MTRRSQRQRSSGLFLALALVGVAGCAGDEAPQWQHLARDPGSRERTGVSELVARGGQSFRLVERDGSVWSEASLARADWRVGDPVRNVWVTRAPVLGRGRPADGAAVAKLSSEGRGFAALEDAGQVADAAVGSFGVTAEAIFLRLEAGQEPPERCDFALYAGSVGGGHAVEGRRFSGEALALWPGQSLTCGVQLSEPRCLRFATASEPMIAIAKGRLPITFRIRLEGDVVFEHVHANARAEGYAWHQVELPAAGGRAELRFEVEGAPAYSAFFAPAIGPLEIGRYGTRPWGATRPDIVMFLADTFRADNLEAYGSTLGLTPYIDRLAERSLLFQRAWSVSTYTMPAHASMFSGYYARQAWGITNSALPDELTTIAEFLSSRGYRTAAITDSTIVSQVHGLAQGFEWFDELRSSLSSTVERTRALLDADDGRPLFLFVQSYRAHAPYRVSQKSARRHGRTLGLDEDFRATTVRLDALYRELGAAALANTHRHKLSAVREVLEERGPQATEEAARFASILASLHAQYRAGVADLDHGFAELHKGFEQRGLLERGYFLFTSDHGEAFMEHDRAFHGGKGWEELARVPLFLSGPGVQPGVFDHAASLIDIAPTLAHMAGFQPQADWLGTPLLKLDEDRPIFLFENQDREGSSYAVVDGTRKAYGLEDIEGIRRGECSDAFELGSDAHELHNLASAEDWPRELLLEMASRVEFYVTPIVAPEAADLDETKLEELRAMGYVGD